MKKLVYTFSLLGALAVGANADVTKGTPANTDAEGCYLIGSAGELLGFAEIVNGIPNAENPEEYDTDPQPGVCGKLTRNISFIEGTLLNEDLTGFNGNQAPAANNWTPMENFSGKFDGQGYTISGLFYGGTDVTNAEGWPEKAGLFLTLSGYAEVKNVRIEDSYFGATTRVAGFATEVDGSEITIDRCSFRGTLRTPYSEKSEPLAYAGGLVAVIISNATLSLKSSVNMGHIIPQSDKQSKNVTRAGLVGYFQDNSTLNVKNSHNFGKVNSKYNQGFISSNNSLATLNTDKKIYCLGTGTSCNAQYCGLSDTDFLRNEKGGVSNDSITKYLNIIVPKCEKAYLSNLENEIGFKGVSLEYGTRDDGRKIVIAHITEKDASSDDNVLQELVIPEDFPVDSVDFDRPFSGKSSTVMIPFDIAAANVTNYDGDNVFLGSVESINCENDEIKACTATATNTQAQIEAHTPYLVSAFDVNQEMEPIGNIPVGQTIHFHGPVVLKKNEATEYSANVGANWSLVGTYKTLITTSKDDASAESDYEKVSMLGKIFGFVGTAGVSDGEGDNKHDFTLGEFARAGHNVRTREMRSYLIYTPPTVVPSLAPSINGMQRAAAPTAETELPASIPVTFKTRSIISVPAFVDTTVKPTTMVQVIMPTFSDDECESPDGECEEGTTAIAKPFVTPFKSNKIDRWQDAMGRNLNGKPTKHGTYFKNGIPVIIK